MPLQFQPPFPIKQAKTKEEALAETLGPTIQSLPLLFMQYKLEKQKLASQLAEQELKERQFRAQFGTLGGDLQTKSGVLPGVAPTPQEFGAMTGPEQLTAFGIEGIKALRQPTEPFLRETYFVNPGTKEIFDSSGTKVQSAPPGSIVKILPLSPEDLSEREQEKKTSEQARKIGEAINKLATLNNQFKEAFPSGDRTPLDQRISGKIESFKSKFGLTDNAKLVALQRNIRPLSINLIRLFGEVGNLSETEQQGAIDVINQTTLTDKERIQSTRQFIEFALSGADPKALEKIKSRKDIQGILDSFGIILEKENTSEKTPKRFKILSIE